MKSKIAMLAFVLTLGTARYAAAQDHPFVAYQNALLDRSLSPADKAICEKKAGKDTASARYSACHVTRLFLSDIKANRDKGYPKLADIDYANDAEADQLFDRMTKYSK